MTSNFEDDLQFEVVFNLNQSHKKTRYHAKISATVEQLTLLSSVTYKLKKSIFLPIEMVNNFICRTCSRPKLPYLT
jgi:hypothetical protein